MASATMALWRQDQVLQEGARNEPELASLWNEIAQRRAANMRRFVAEVTAEHGLPEGRTLEEAADLIWATNGPEFYLLLVEERDWTVERFELQLREIWLRLLLP